MLIKNGQLKIKTINGKIVAKPDLKTAIGSGATRKYAVAKKGVRYRKIYKTNQSRYMLLLEDIADFNKSATIEKKQKIDVKDAALTGATTGIGGGLGSGFLIGEYLARNKNKAAKTKYGVGGAIAGTVGLGTLGAYQSARQQKKALKSNNSSSTVLASFSSSGETKKKKKIVKPYTREGRQVRGYTVDSDGKKRYLTPEEMHYEKNQRAKEELQYKQRRLDQAKAREERLQREDKRRPVEDVRKNVSAAVNVSREAKGWINTGHKIFGWFK
jgi:hypothetical protein